MQRMWSSAVRYRYVVLAVWAAAWAVPIRLANMNSTDYGYFLAGGRILTGGSLGSYHTGPLHLYAYAPTFQIGPPPLILDGLLERAAPAIAEPIWWSLIMLCGLGAIWAVERIAAVATGARERVRSQTFIGGAIAIPCWASLEHFVHLDDALATLGILVALAAIASRRQWWLPALSLGFAAACKPWAAMALPLLLLVSSRRRLAAVAVAFAAIAAWWGPFIVGDRGTLSALDSTQPVVTDRAVIRALGYSRFFAPPHVHLLEIVLGASVVALVCVRGNWTFAPLAAFAVRLAVEPKYLLYYGVGPVVAALLVDMTSGRRIPAWTLGTAAVEYGAQQYLPSRVGAVSQLVLVLAIVVGALDVGPGRRPRTVTPTDTPRPTRAGDLVSINA